MPTARYALAAVAADDGRIYVLGGSVAIGQYTPVVEAYDPETGTWDTVPPLSNGRYGLAAAALGERIYALGGFDGNNDYVGTVESLVVGAFPPTVSCDGPDGVWHSNNISIRCTAEDKGGLKDPSDASFSLATSVPRGVETAAAATGTRAVCDVFDNCSTAGPITGNKIDRKKPSIAMSVPQQHGVYHLNERVLASYLCSDQGSGVGSCKGTVPAGAPIDTGTLGKKQFRVTARDTVGNVVRKKRTYKVVE